jgi:DNA-binding CsgD family transcriptional regulator
MSPDSIKAEILEAARASRSREEFVRFALGTFSRVSDGDSAVFTFASKGASPVAVGFDPASLALLHACEKNSEAYQGDVKKGELALLVSGGFIEHEVYTSEERRNLRIYREAIKPQRISSFLVAGVRWRTQFLGDVRVERHGVARPFDGKALERVQQIMIAFEAGMAAHSAGETPGREGSDRTVERDFSRLTAREREIANYVNCGLTNPAIAEILGTSPRTVRNQLSSIFEKTGTANRLELAVWLERAPIRK